MSNITPTSCAILGLLARRDWSAYELNKAMQENIARTSWPRVESRIYSEVKNLHRLGLASSQEEHQGGRKRTVYRITDEGQQALHDWLETTGGRMRLEYETLLQLAFAEQGESDCVERLVDTIAAQTREELEEVVEGCKDLVERGTWRFPEAAHLNVLTVRFVREMAEARLRWSEQARDYLANLDKQAISEEALNEYREEIVRLNALLNRR